MFCMYAFDQKYPKDGFGELAWQVVRYAGKLPLGLKVLGSYFRGMSKKEWKDALPKVWRILDGKIESILKFSYDALDYEDKNLFLHIACFFKNGMITSVKENLSKRFTYVDEGLDVLANKSLIYLENDEVHMHDLLVQLGKEIVRRQSPDEPGQRQFLVDCKDISEILARDATGSEKVIGIKYGSYRSELNISLSISESSELYISESVFEGMYNLQFLKIEGYISHLPHRLSYISPKLRLLDWWYSPLTCFPSNVNLKFLVELNMCNSKLEKLWEGIKPLPNLKWMDLSDSKNLKELPNLSTATSLQRLNLERCTSLVGVPDSIGSLHKLEWLFLSRCSKLEVLPVHVNLKSLDVLHFRGCSSLKIFPEISTNIRYLNLRGTAIEEVPSSIRSWSRLKELNMSNCKNLKKFMHDLDSITERDTKIQEVSPLVQEEFPCLKLILKNCKNLVSLSQLPDSLSYLNARNCESLERLDWSLSYPGKNLKFANCFKLNKEARDLIIQASTCHIDAVLPGREIPTYFTHRAKGCSLTVKLKERPFPFSLKFKACILLFKENDGEEENNGEDSNDEGDEESNDVKSGKYIELKVVCKQENIVYQRWIPNLEDRLIPLPNHLYIFDIEAVDVTPTNLFIEFRLLKGASWVMMKWGVRFEDCEAEAEENEGRSVDEEEENGLVSVTIDAISKYTSNSEARRSKSKVIKTIHEHAGEENMEEIANALLSSEISDVPAEVKINGDCEAEEERNGDNSAETKKRKKQSPFIDIVEVANHGDCEAEEEINEDYSAKTKKSRASFNHS